MVSSYRGYPIQIGSTVGSPNRITKSGELNDSGKQNIYSCSKIWLLRLRILALGDSVYTILYIN